jgi:hypothetical protein
MLPSADGRGELEIRNGQLGTIVRCDTSNLVVKLDGNEETVRIPIARYNDIDHGYALTVHKTQGATVNRAYVVESPGMDRNLLYVAMSRHRDSCILLADQTRHADTAKLLEALSRRHNVKETTLDYLAPGSLSPAEQAWVSAESQRRRPTGMDELKKQLASADYETRRLRSSRSTKMKRKHWRRQSRHCGRCCSAKSPPDR